MAISNSNTNKMSYASVDVPTEELHTSVAFNAINKISEVLDDLNVKLNEFEERMKPFSLEAPTAESGPIKNCDTIFLDKLDTLFHKVMQAHQKLDGINSNLQI